MEYPMNLEYREALHNHAEAIDQALPAQLDHLLARLDSAMRSVKSWSSRRQLDEALWKEMQAERAGIPLDNYEITEVGTAELARAYALELVMRGGPDCLRQNIARLRGAPEPTPSAFSRAHSLGVPVLKRGLVITLWVVIGAALMFWASTWEFETQVIMLLILGFGWLGWLIEKNSPRRYDAERREAEDQAVWEEWERARLRFWDDRQHAYLRAKKMSEVGR